MLEQLKTAAKNALAIPVVRSTYEHTMRTTLDVAASTRITATLYSLVGFFTFNREQYAVLAGRRAYYHNFGKNRPSHVELRRNIHRLEKGLLMEPQRPVFAKDYIGETISFYAKALATNPNHKDIDQAELTWATDVLNKYFTTVDTSDPAISPAYAEFQRIAHPTPLGHIDRHTTPYPHSEVAPLTVNYDELLQLARRRRSVRWFKDEPVPRELIDKALIVAREAPTACNREPFEFLIFDEPELTRKVASIPFGASGYADQIPTVIVVKGSLDAYFSPRDRHVPYIDASLATMQFMLALETLGLGSSIINWPDFEPLELKMQKKLRLRPYERVIFLIAVGFPRDDAKVASSVKKSLSVLRRYNEKAN